VLRARRSTRSRTRPQARWHGHGRGRRGYPDAVQLHAEDRGPRSRADALVLLHGLGSSSADWALQLPAFEKRYRVILIDLPGHGCSPLPRRRPTVEAMAASLDVTRAHMLGLSLGGCVALAFALRAPARARSLTLVNAFARLRPAGLRGAWRMAVRLALLTTAPMTAVAAHVARGLFPRPEQHELYAAAVASLSRTPRAGYLAAARALARFDARDQLATLRCPTLIVAGAMDRTVPLATQHALARAIPAARLSVVPNSGHATPHDQPDLFTHLVLTFLEPL